MTNQLNSSQEVLLHSWIEEDKYLSGVMNENFDHFSSEIDFDEEPLSVIPLCRELARKSYLDTEALDEFAAWCVSDQQLINLNMELIRLFFCQEIEHMFCELFANNFKQYVQNEKLLVTEVVIVLKEKIADLKGASAKRLTLQKWG